MRQAIEALEGLRLRIAARGAVATLPEYREYLVVASAKESVDVWFYGSPFDESYLEVLGCLGDPSVSPWVRSFSLAGPDEGANGTRNWNLEPLLERSPLFERLELISVQLNQAADHNRSIVGDIYEENGVIARILQCSPRLRTLQVPSAPDATFFEVPADSLEHLSVDAGFATQDFIANLARSSNLGKLRSLEWGEYHETYMESWQSRCTPTADYATLLKAPVLSKVSRFVWRNPACSEDDIKALKASRKDLQLLVVRSSARYA